MELPDLVMFVLIYMMRRYLPRAVRFLSRRPVLLLVRHDDR